MHRRSATALMVPAGALVGHAVVPALSHAHGVTSHPILHAHGAEPVVVAVAAVAGLLGLARASLSRSGGPPVEFGLLAGLQSGLYAAVELVEVGGRASVLLADRTFWLGIAVQFVLAVAVALVARAGRRLVDRLRRQPARLVPPPSEVAGHDWPVPRPRVAQFLTCRVVRGPPTARTPVPQT